VSDVKIKKRRGFTLVEVFILIIVGTIMIASVFSGVNLILDSLQYSKKVMYKLYTRKEIDMTFELLDYEIKRTGSLGPLIKNLNGFYKDDDANIEEGNENKGVFAIAENEFAIQYGVTYPFVLKKKMNTTSTYEKIIKNKDIEDQARISIDGSEYWPVVTSGKYLKAPKTVMLPEASALTDTEDATTINITDAATRIYFIYFPHDKVPAEKLEIENEKVYGRRLHRINYVYGKEPDEDASTLKMVKYFPFIDKSATSVLLKNLVNFKIEYGFGSAEIEYNDFNEVIKGMNNMADLAVLKISIVSFVPESNASISASKVFWLP